MNNVEGRRAESQPRGPEVGFWEVGQRGVRTGCPLLVVDGSWRLSVCPLHQSNVSMEQYDSCTVHLGLLPRSD